MANARDGMTTSGHRQDFHSSQELLAPHGIALLSHLLVADDISAGRLRVLMPAFPPARFPLTVVYPSRRNLPPRVRAVIEFLSEIIQADPAMRGDGDVQAASHTEVYGQD
jgi:DNA-binding transcriptional LysR family regulator